MNVNKWFCQSGHFKSHSKSTAKKVSHKCDSNKGLFKSLHCKVKRAGLTNRTLLDSICQEEMSSESLLLQHYENHMRHVAVEDSQN